MQKKRWRSTSVELNLEHPLNIIQYLWARLRELSYELAIDDRIARPTHEYVYQLACKANLLDSAIEKSSLKLSIFNDNFDSMICLFYDNFIICLKNLKCMDENE